MPEGLITLSKHACFGSAVSFHEHRSETRDVTMRFAVYPQCKVHGFHIYTFNEVGKTEAWRRRELNNKGAT